MNNSQKEKLLITGAGGMLGQYVVQEFQGSDIKTLGVRSESDIICDLTKSLPDFSGIRFDTVIHLAGTEEDSKAFQLNLEGTKNLIQSLEDQPPANFVFVSSYKVYSRDAGENVKEDANTWADDETGKSKARAEQLLRDWAEKNDVTLTIIRPARMFGNGVSGETLRLFNDAVKGYYIHIRGNDAKVSLVTALDVARSIRVLYKRGGIYNAADGHNPRFIEMVESMTANAGAKKRMTHLPAVWAEWLWRLGRWIPSIERNLAPAIVEKRMKTLTLDGSYLEEASGICYHDTISVMEHSDPSYPYSYNRSPQSHPYEA